MAGFRRFHRWLATVGLPLFVWLTLTGTITAVYQLYDPPKPFGTSDAPSSGGGVALPGKEAWPQLMRTVTNAAWSHQPQGPSRQVSIRLRMLGGRPVGTVTWDGDEVHAASFDAISGARVPEEPRPKPPPSIGRLLVALHSGAIFQGPGQVVIAAGGGLAAFLTITGLGLYLSLWFRRRRNHKTSIFWR